MDQPPILEEDPESALANVPLWALSPVEALCGIISASLISPFVSIIDTSISANAGGVNTLKAALTTGFKMLFFQPHKFIAWRPFQ